MPNLGWKYAEFQNTFFNLQISFNAFLFSGSEPEEDFELRDRIRREAPGASRHPIQAQERVGRAGK